MNNNYPSASQVIRNLSDVKTNYEIMEESGKFRIVQFDPPFFGGFEFWIVNEKGFLWEPGDSLDAIFDYLNTDEAKTYNAS